MQRRSHAAHEAEHAVFGGGVIGAAHWLEAGTGSGHHYVATSWLLAHVVYSQRDCIDDSSQIDVEGQERWLKQVACFVKILSEVVGTACNASVREDMVYRRVCSLGFSEEVRKISPGRHVGSMVCK